MEILGYVDAAWITQNESGNKYTDIKLKTDFYQYKTTRIMKQHLLFKEEYIKNLYVEIQLSIFGTLFDKQGYSLISKSTEQLFKNTFRMCKVDTLWAICNCKLSNKTCIFNVIAEM